MSAVVFTAATSPRPTRTPSPRGLGALGSGATNHRRDASLHAGLGRLRREQRVVLVEVRTPQLADRLNGVVRAGGIDGVQYGGVPRLLVVQTEFRRTGGVGVTQQCPIKVVRRAVAVLPTGDAALHAGVRGKLMPTLGGSPA
jgi:hypothetical protein